MSPEAFGEVVARCGRGAAGELAAEDLYFVTACLAGNPAALSLLMTRVLGVIREALLRRGQRRDVVDDVLASLCDRLLFGQEGTPPLLLRYGGRGSFEGWLLRAAWRDLLKVIEREKRGATVDEDALPATPRTDPELLFFVRAYGPELRAAISEALSDLGPDERRLLRRVLAEQSATDIARSARVHRVTVNRWLAAIRQRIADRVAATLASKLQLSPPELSALLRVSGSELDVSVHRLLAEPAADRSGGRRRAPPKRRAKR